MKNACLPKKSAPKSLLSAHCNPLPPKALHPPPQGTGGLQCPPPPQGTAIPPPPQGIAPPPPQGTAIPPPPRHCTPPRHCNPPQGIAPPPRHCNPPTKALHPLPQSEFCVPNSEMKNACLPKKISSKVLTFCALQPPSPKALHPPPPRHWGIAVPPPPPKALQSPPRHCTPPQGTAIPPKALHPPQALQSPPRHCTPPQGTAIPPTKALHPLPQSIGHCNPAKELIFHFELTRLLSTSLPGLPACPGQTAQLGFTLRSQVTEMLTNCSSLVTSGDAP